FASRSERRMGHMARSLQRAWSESILSLHSMHALRILLRACHPAGSARMDVMEALDLLGPEARPARDLLLEAVTSEQTLPGPRRYAARALGHLYDDAEVIVPKLIELLEKTAEGYQRVMNCEYAAEALGMLGPRAKAALPHLRHLLEDD